MSKVVSLKLSKDPVEEASLWIAKLDRGLTVDEKASLKQWLDSDEKHAELFFELVKLWDKMESLSQLSDLFPHKPEKQKKSAFAPWAMAASVFVATLVSVGVWQFTGKNASPQIAQVVQFKNSYQTKVGEQTTIVLQDDTKVELNTNSRVQVTYTDKQRLFELQQGEMHVTVAHNTSQPLSVYAGDKVIQAVGTAFNVEIVDDAVELIVTDGKVLVADVDERLAKPLTLTEVRLPSQSLAVEKGQKAQLEQGRNSLVQEENLKVEVDLAWQQGSLIFRGETLEQAMREVARYTKFEFQFGDDSIKNVQVAGLFKTTDIDGLLIALEQNFNVKYEKVDFNTIQLSQK